MGPVKESLGRTRGGRVGVGLGKARDLEVPEAIRGPILHINAGCAMRVPVPPTGRRRMGSVGRRPSLSGLGGWGAACGQAGRVRAQPAGGRAGLSGCAARSEVAIAWPGCGAVTGGGLAVRSGYRRTGYHRFVVHSTLLCLSSREFVRWLWGHGGDEGAVELAGDVALEAAAYLVVGFAFGAAAGDVGDGGGVAAHPAGGDDVDGHVECPVAAPVEAVAGDLAAGCLEGAGAGEVGEGGVVAAGRGVMP
jgi:hypothetical protein